MDVNLAQEEETMTRNEAMGLDEAVASPPRGFDPDLGRRAFLRRGLAAAGGLALGGIFETFLARAVRGQQGGAGYGPMQPVTDPTTGLPLLKLPEGFSYFSFGWTGDPMKGGVSTPSLHDGMAAIPVGEGRFVLIRNHEVGAVSAFRAPTYDPRAGGGTTNILFNTQTGQIEQTWPSLAGTIRNCAGGYTPWGTWLTCEENFSTPTNPPGTGITKTHGWIFEVPAFGWAAPVPLTDMGRFSHEAISVDPATDIVYETQDQTGASGFFRFLPNVRQNLRMGGTLQMMAAKGPQGTPAQALDGALPVGSTYDVAWVTIPNPSLQGMTGSDSALANAVFNQGFPQGGSRFFRLEGTWYGNGKIYFDDTGGNSHFGQIWEYDPAAETLRLIFSSRSRAVLDMADNLAVSPRTGGLVLCEDGGNPVQKLQSLTTTGLIAPFAENNIIIPAGSGNPKPQITPGSYTDFEWAGSTFVPGGPFGQWLFVNIQTPGVTFAITGPWERGAL